MADLRPKRVTEFVAPFRVEPGRRVRLPRDFGPAGTRQVTTHAAKGIEPATAAVLSTEHLTVGRLSEVHADDTWTEAGRKVLRLHLVRMLARMPGVIAGEDPEEVHAMRVAARRMRGAWRVFGDGFKRNAVRRYRGELRDIGARLGAVRDLDVLIEILGTYGERRGGHQSVGLEPLHTEWCAEREARRVDLLEALGSERFAVFLRDYEDFAQTPGIHLAFTELQSSVRDYIVRYGSAPL